MANEVDNFLEQVDGKEAPDPLVKDESDPLANTTSDKKEVVGDDNDDKPLPFHKDPKVQRYIEKEIGKRIKDIRPNDAPSPKGDESTEDELTDTLVEIIGNDTPQKIAAIKRFRSQLGTLEERGAERALAQLRQQADAEQLEVQQAQEELATAFDNIEEEFDVDLTSNTSIARKERGDFIDFIKRVSPKNSDGDVIQYPDFTETWKLFQSTKKPVDNKRAKDLAARGMDRSTDSGTAPTKGQTWKDVEREFAKFK